MMAVAPPVVVVVAGVVYDEHDVVVVDGAPPVVQHGEPENQHFLRTPWSRKSRISSLRIPS